MGINYESIDELRSNFDPDFVLEAFEDGSLLSWCEEMFYDTIAAKIKNAAEITARRGENGETVSREDILEMITDALGIKNTEKQLAAENKLSDLTQDKELLKKAQNTAYNQRELGALLHGGCRDILLCEGDFTIPLSVENVTYTAVGDPRITAEADRAELIKKHISINNYILPGDEENYRLFGEIALDFVPEKYSLHIYLKKRTKEYTRYDSESECRECMKNHINAIYNEAAKYLDTTHVDCIGRTAASYYSEQMEKAFKKHEAALKGGLSESDFEALRKLCECSKLIKNDCAAELSDGNYYSLYDRDYFWEQPDIEEIVTGFEDVGILFPREREVKKYYYKNAHKIPDELEKDINDLARTLYSFAYRTFCDKVRDPVIELLKNIREPAVSEI